MDVTIEFVIGNQATGEVTPAPALTLTSTTGITTPPAVGDIVPLEGKNYRVVQRAYIVESKSVIDTRGTFTSAKKSLVWSIVLIPIGKEGAPNADEK